MQPIKIHFNDNQSYDFVGELICNFSKSSDAKLHEMTIYRSEAKEYICFQIRTCFDNINGIYNVAKVEACDTVEDMFGFFTDKCFGTADTKSIDSLLTNFKMQINSESALNLVNEKSPSRINNKREL